MAKLYTNVEGTLDIDLKVSEVITIVLNKDLDINYHFEDGDYKVLVFNNADKDITLIEQGEVINSNVEINYLDLNRFNLKHQNKIEVNAHSELIINSTYLGCNDKDIKFDLINKEWDSKVNISNKVVCLNQADFKMTIIGKIVNGAKNCKCHQKSNCLTLSPVSLLTCVCVRQCLQWRFPKEKICVASTITNQYLSIKRALSKLLLWINSLIIFVLNSSNSVCSSFSRTSFTVT